MQLYATLCADSALRVCLCHAAGERLGKNKFWHELTCAEANAAHSLGYDDEGWDKGFSPAACNQPWATLSSKHVRAAKVCCTRVCIGARPRQAENNDPRGPRGVMMPCPEFTEALKAPMKSYEHTRYDTAP